MAGSYHVPGGHLLYPGTPVVRVSMAQLGLQDRNLLDLAFKHGLLAEVHLHQGCGTFGGCRRCEHERLEKRYMEMDRVLNRKKRRVE